MRRWFAAAATLGVLVGAQFTAAATANAHAAFDSSNPAAGSTLTVLPASVELTFSETVGFPAALAVTDPEGNTIETGDLAVVDRAMTQALDISDTVSGTYQIVYAVTSADGHPISGTIEFVLAASAGAQAALKGGIAPASPGAAPAGGGIANPALVLVLLFGLGGGLTLAGFGLRRAVVDMTKDSAA